MPDWKHWRAMANDTLQAAELLQLRYCRRNKMPEAADIVADWLKQAAAERGIADRFSATYLRADRDWLYFAVRLSNAGDASERANILLDLEDAWEAHQPNTHWHLMLMPAGA